MSLSLPLTAILFQKWFVISGSHNSNLFGHQMNWPPFVALKCFQSLCPARKKTSSHKKEIHMVNSEAFSASRQCTKMFKMHLRKAALC